MTPMEELCDASGYPGRTPRVYSKEWVLKILADTGTDIDPEGVLYPVVDDGRSVVPLVHGAELYLLIAGPYVEPDIDRGIFSGRTR